MTPTEAQILAQKLNLSLPQRKAADALLDALETLGYVLGVEHSSGDWVVYDANDQEVARCQ